MRMRENMSDVVRVWSKRNEKKKQQTVNKNPNISIAYYFHCGIFFYWIFMFAYFISVQFFSSLFFLLSSSVLLAVARLLFLFKFCRVFIRFSSWLSIDSWAILCRLQWHVFFPFSFYFSGFIFRFRCHYLLCYGFFCSLSLCVLSFSLPPSLSRLCVASHFFMNRRIVSDC